MIDNKGMGLDIYVDFQLKVCDRQLSVIHSNGSSSIVKSPNIRCFVAKSVLLRFTHFLGVRFPAFDSINIARLDNDVIFH